MSSIFYITLFFIFSVYVLSGWGTSKRVRSIVSLAAPFTAVTSLLTIFDGVAVVSGSGSLIRVLVRGNDSVKTFFSGDKTLLFLIASVLESGSILTDIVTRKEVLGRHLLSCFAFFVLFESSAISPFRFDIDLVVGLVFAAASDCECSIFLCFVAVFITTSGKGLGIPLLLWRSLLALSEVILFLIIFLVCNAIDSAWFTVFFASRVFRSSVKAVDGYFGMVELKISCELFWDAHYLRASNLVEFTLRSIIVKPSPR